MSAKKIMRIAAIQKHVPMVLAFSILASGLYAQTRPSGLDISDWTLNGGIGTSDILVDGLSFGLILDPKLRLTQNLMIGSKNAINFSTDEITALETQAYLRWNFLRLGFPQNPINVFAQGGMGLLVAYRGSDVTKTRGSMLFDATAGITIPLSDRWHIEPSVRVGYPFVSGVAITTGVKFPLQQKVVRERLPMVEYIEIIRELPPVEIIRELPPAEIVKRIMITQIEYILFGPDSPIYNEGVGADAMALNDLVIMHVAKLLRENPNYIVRIEGHANPVTHAPEETEVLLSLSEKRANEVAKRLKANEVKEEQIVVIAYGGTRIVTGDHDHWNMNRRVELIIKQVDVE